MKFVLGNWNRIVIEISQGQPQEFEIGFSAVRVWVNSNVIPRVYFGNFFLGKSTVYDGDNAALDLCGAFESTSPNKVSQALQGYYDMLNFVWYQGAQNLFQGPPSNNQMVIENS